ncbi:MAG: glycerol kinase GlpK [Proteobacteria bacterium]|nr:glycerol kinase GlpK [Desulfobacula sp.]MBU3952151.1 glycerol kinase GlpK [Pseudomonadota bacterium]MBU4131761.1 glycerol kinase GlpK [Pseudomonadota bacterium]
MAAYLGAVDQGTTSTRFIIFDKNGAIISLSQMEHDQICQKPGWVEHDASQIWKNTQRVITQALDKAGLSGQDLAAIGVTNQRETVMVWDRHTGKPLHNAIVWQCTRSHETCKQLDKNYGKDGFRSKTGLPTATYFSGPKIKWMMDKNPEIKRAVDKGDAICGTMDTWIIWNLTGGPDKGRHVTDVTNASRTLLMNLNTLEWDDEILKIMGIPKTCLPQIVPSSHATAFGKTTFDGPFKTQIPVGGALGDQQAALFGQTCFEPGEAKNTYGTGCFLLFNTGSTIRFSDHGLLTTVGYQIGSQNAVYALEGSIAYAGALVQWVRDNLGLVSSSPEIETLANTVADNGDVYCVPAFSGLFAPYWRSDARGVIAGLTQFANKGHIARAVLEACAFQTKDIVEAINQDLGKGLDLKGLKVDGGMVANNTLMQFQADILNVSVTRPGVAETTALGAAYAAGLAVGFWPDTNALKENWHVHSTWEPDMEEPQRKALYDGWKKAVQRTLAWKE